MDITVGVYYRPLIQDNDTDELFSKDNSRSATLVLLRDISLPDVNWKYHTIDTNNSRRFLKHLDIFLVQILRDLTRNRISPRFFACKQRWSHG